MKDMDVKPSYDGMDEEERVLFVEDVVKTIRDDIDGSLNEIIIDDSLVEKNLHFEDIHQRDHLNENIDIDDIRIENVLRQIQQIDEDKFSKLVDATYIRKMCDSTKEIRMHMDSGANRSITDDDRLLYDVRNIAPYYMFLIKIVSNLPRTINRWNTLVVHSNDKR